MATESKFEELLQENLSWKNYENLDMLLGVSQHRLTKILAKPSMMSIEELKKISTLADESVSRLINEFDCGSENITIQQASELGLTVNS
ncbi:MAG: hypothetical protein ACKVQV_15920 [Bacteroidia bacterium]